MPGARGSRLLHVGSEPTRVTLEGALKGSSRFEDFEEFKRRMLLGESLKFDCDMLKTIVFICDVNLVRQDPTVLRYALTLQESLFKQLHTCDSLSNWAAPWGGALSLDSSLVKEGESSIKYTVEFTAAGWAKIDYEPIDPMDLTDYDWLAFWFRVPSKDKIEKWFVQIYTDDNNYVKYEWFPNEININTWHRIRINKSDFSTVAGTIDWSKIAKIVFYISVTEAVTTTFYLDDIGVYQ